MCVCVLGVIFSLPRGRGASKLCLACGTSSKLGVDHNLRSSNHSNSVHTQLISYIARYINIYSYGCVYRSSEELLLPFDYFNCVSFFVVVLFFCILFFFWFLLLTLHFCLIDDALVSCLVVCFLSLPPSPHRPCSPALRPFFRRHQQ